jgi:hypothetical protein
MNENEKKSALTTLKSITEMVECGEIEGLVVIALTKDSAENGYAGECGHRMLGAISNLLFYLNSLFTSKNVKR